MSRTDPVRRRKLPSGLTWCQTCGEARGRSSKGGLSVCLCQGVVCSWCGQVWRRPITDYYGRDGSWWHVPSFTLQAHRCPAPRELRVGRQWTPRPANDDVRAYNEVVSALAWEEVEERARAREAAKDAGEPDPGGDGAGQEPSARAIMDR